MSLATVFMEACGGLACRNFANNPNLKPYSVFARRPEILAHEIGHNLGCRHGDISGSDCSNYGYYNGYRFYADGQYYVTLMRFGYASGVRCDLFSNPGVEFRGVPAGTVTENNARKISEMAGILAASCEARGYVLGKPSCAPNERAVSFQVRGRPCRAARLEFSSDMRSWENGLEITLDTGCAWVTNRAGSSGRRFYRIVSD